MSTPETAHILVVDDEPSLLQLIDKYLSRLGYHVEACRSGEEAWKRFSEDPARAELVIADLNLPDMSGEELVRRILELHPSVHVLICSGYPFDVSTLDLADASRVSFLQKPFLPVMLAEAIESLLRKPAAN